MSPSEYSPQKSVDVFEAKYGEVGMRVLECFNHIDPLHVFFEENIDEYIGYARRFMEKMGTRNFNDLKREEITELVRGSFHSDQIGKFVTDADLELLIERVSLIRL